jgi:hypothetical protein
MGHGSESPGPKHVADQGRPEKPTSVGQSLTPPRSGADLPELFGEPPPPDSPDRLRIDELTDKLIEKREKLEYFIITAAIAVIVFTFKDFNDQHGLLHLVDPWVPAAGWIVLLAASGCALFALRRRHSLISINQDWRYENRTSAKDEREAWRIKWNTRLNRASDLLMGILFVSGMSLVGAAYTAALSQR